MGKTKKSAAAAKPNSPAAGTSAAGTPAAGTPRGGTPEATPPDSNAASDAVIVAIAPLIFRAYRYGFHQDYESLRRTLYKANKAIPTKFSEFPAGWASFFDQLSDEGLYLHRRGVHTAEDPCQGLRALRHGNGESPAGPYSRKPRLLRLCRIQR
jgi:hypothetical protein